MKNAIHIISWINVIIAIFFVIVGLVDAGQGTVDSSTVWGIIIIGGSLGSQSVVALRYANKYPAESELDKLKAKVAALEARE